MVIADGQQKHLPALELTVASSGCSGPPIVDYIRLLEKNKGDLGGTVRLDLGPLAGKSPTATGVKVDLFCGMRTLCRSVQTNARGEFLFASLPPGRFAIRISRLRPKKAPAICE